MSVLLSARAITEGDEFPYLGNLILRLEAGGHAVLNFESNDTIDERSGLNQNVFTLYCEDCTIIGWTNGAGPQAGPCFIRDIHPAVDPADFGLPEGEDDDDAE
jgi:hypothetical protein